MKRVELISFDADQTLFDFKKIMRQALSAVCSTLMKKYKITVTVDELIKTRDTIAAEYESSTIDMLELRKMSFEQVLKKNSIRDDDGIKELNHIFQQERFGTVYFYNDTISTLDRLKDDYLLALITNGNSHPKKAGIGDYFSFVIAGEKYAYKKPDKRLFEILTSQSKIPSHNIIHIGDSLRNDVQGANNAGMCSVWLNRDGVENKSNYQPCYEVRELMELPELLRTL